MLSQTGQYALRAMGRLAAWSEDGKYHLAREISRELGIPQQYLSKVLHTLARRGLLDSQRGRQGGFRLSRPAGEISLHEVLDPLEDLSRFEECLLGGIVCSDSRSCVIHDKWGELREKYVSFLKNTKLNQLVISR